MYHQTIDVAFRKRAGARQVAGDDRLADWKCMRLFGLFAFVIFCSLGLPGTARCSDTDDAEAAFSRMKSMLGAWKKAGTIDTSLQIDFTLTANETVLVESWTRNGAPHSLTLYHHDGDHVLATHYCAQGNQPRLVMSATKSDRLVSFAFKDATNLKSLDASHLHALSFEFAESGDAVVRRETYLSESGADASSLVLERIP